MLHPVLPVPVNGYRGLELVEGNPCPSFCCFGSCFGEPDVAQVDNFARSGIDLPIEPAPVKLINRVTDPGLSQLVVSQYGLIATVRQEVEVSASGPERERFVLGDITEVEFYVHIAIFDRN